MTKSSSAIDRARTMVGLAFAALLVGCGGDSESVPKSTSNEDIAAFLEENPEYAEPKTDSGSQELGLER